MKALKMKGILRELSCLGFLLLFYYYRSDAQSVQPSFAEVPVLCYHQIRDYTSSDHASAKSITVTPSRFAAHMQMLADSGFQTILPADLYAHYTTGRALPCKPIIISFDDNTAFQYFNALPVLNKHGFKAVFFVMTVSINKPLYMSTAQLIELKQKGHTIGGHTWDHKNMKQYKDADWNIQLDKPFKTLQSITGEPVYYFAYPSGAWSQQAIDALEKRGIRMAFILHTQRDEKRPLFTQRRLMVMGSWSAATLHSKMVSTFPGK